jgi:hypothetical protein
LKVSSGDIIRLRLLNQHISSLKFTSPMEAVKWMGAVQAQDYLGSLWAVGLRVQNSTEKSIEQSFADRKIIRTWPMRGTLHFVAASYARWMLGLLSRRLIAFTSGREKRVGLNSDILDRCRDIFINAMQGGKQLQRDDMYKLLEENGIPTGNFAGIHVLARMSYDCVICFGPRNGKQHTFVLFDEWVPASKSMTHDEALSELTLRYFTSHGPATIQDFAWWTGMTLTEARLGLEMVKPQLDHLEMEDQVYWLNKIMPEFKDNPKTISLLPAFDEYLVSYKDRSAAIEMKYRKQVYTNNGIFNPSILTNGVVTGSWKRTLKKEKVFIQPTFFVEPDKSQNDELEETFKEYCKFLGRPFGSINSL